MKTLANCNSIEFMSQIYKVSEKLKSYVDGIKKAKEAYDGGEKNAFRLISYICNDNINETMELCGAMCFMTGNEFAALDPAAENGEDGIVAVSEVFSSERCMAFFTSAFKMKTLYDML